MVNSTISDKEAMELLESLGYRIKGVGPDEHPDKDISEEEKQAAFRWDQIGQLENIARRRARAQNADVDEKYSGPDATKNERMLAYEDFLKTYPWIKRIEI